MLRKFGISTFFVLHFVLTGYNLWAQEKTTYSFNIQNQSLRFIIKEITQVTNYKFAFSNSEINVDIAASIVCDKTPIEKITEQLSKSFNLNFEIVGTTIVIKPLPIREFKVTGVVADFKDRHPLQGVNIIIPELKKGTVTDSLGNFTIVVPENQNQIQFSYIGYKPEYLSVFSDTVIRIRLRESINALEEIVVIAFGNENKDLLTGSVSALNPHSFSQLNQESLNSSLQSNLSGVFIQNNSGTPAASVKVNIRGISSISAGNTPLYIIDGIPVIVGNYSQLDFSGQTIDAITDLSINDVESISILKDAAASSLYGARASNGVILINTKRGKSGESYIQLDSYYGLQETTGMLDMLNAKQWMTLVNEDALATGKPAIYTQEQIDTNKTDTDWLRKVFRIAPTYNLYLSLGGGTDKAKYYIGANVFNQEGIVIGSDYRRYSFRLNFDYKINERFNLESGYSFSYSINNRVEGDQSINGPLPNAISMPPIYPVYNPNGSFNNDGPYANPVSIAEEEKNLALTYRNMFYTTLTYRLSNKLFLKSQTGIDYYNLGEQTFAPKGTRQGAKYNGLGIEATNKTSYVYNSSYIDYEFIESNHKLSVLAGISIDRYNRHGTYLRAQNFPGNSFEYLQDAATPIAAYSSELDAASNSFFTRTKYNYNDKYILTFNLRADGSSKFGENNRFGYFPSVSALWYLSKEPFFEWNKTFSKFKILASYGITGNDQINDFRSLNLFRAGDNYNGEAGISPMQISNPNLKWESTAQFNAGINFELFNKVTVNAEYYTKNTKDLLFEKPLPTSTGFDYVISNIGRLQNKGFEAQVSANILEGIFGWNVSLSVTSNKNKVLELYQNQPIRNIGRASSSIEEGEPVSYFYGFKSLGVNPADGMLIYKDVYKDDKITDLDKTKIGSPYPIFFGGLGNTFTYKSVSVNVLFFFSYGNDIFNATRMYTETLSTGNQTTDVLRRWQQPDDITDIPKASTYNKRVSSRFVEDGSFVRLKNLKISYSLNERWLQKYRFKTIQIYLAGKNLITWTKYSGMDPEVNYNGSNPVVLGTDFFTNPQPKSLILGVCAKF